MKNEQKTTQRNSFSVKFYCRESKSSKVDGLSPIEMSIILNGERTYIILPLYRMPSKEFNNKPKKEVKDYLEQERFKIYGIYQSLQSPTLDTIKNKYKGVEDKNLSQIKKSNDIKPLYLQYLKTIEDGIGITCGEDHYQKHMVVYKYFCEEYIITDIKNIHHITEL